MARPIIALLTDFGVRDHYAGTLKGVILGICPDVTLVDISHELAPHDVLGGALELAASYRYFPAATIFLVVVDPGVGSARRAIAVEAGDYRYIAPDNGVLGLVLEERPPKRVVELSERRYARPTISRTFEGRDRFAPAAAWLAKGIDLSALGRAAGALTRLDVPKPKIESESGTVVGEVLRLDRFGNLITNIDRRTLEAVTTPGEYRLEIRIGSHQVEKVVSTYADAASGEICALFGSSDHLEIAANGGSASALLNLGRGAPVRVVRGAW
jgi:S-adenosyl-L-methionine hydrolase (adenosine-forming)